MINGKNYHIIQKLASNKGKLSLKINLNYAFIIILPPNIGENS